MRYIILKSISPSTLSKTVSEYLDNGWICQGGVSVSKMLNEFNAVKETYCQAMIWNEKN